ncbi:MAG: protein adenylyltransferase SelO family protein [Allosphingosinicella sp.]
MVQRPTPSPYRSDPAILELGDAFYDAVAPADFPQAILRFRNRRWAPAVGLGEMPDEEWVRHFGRFAPLADNLAQPLALRYHGHQFRVYNPDIGDGRGFLYAQLRDGGAREDGGRLLDLGTKGSGRTPYSRFGDGRLTLKGGVREVLATEMLEALGVETSKSFSLIETGEALERNDEPSPTRAAVLVRLQHSHIRIGTFQRLAFLDQPDNLRTLAAWCLRQYHSDGSGDPAALLGHVAARAARLAASYIAAGFVHGVLNTDNIAVTAESFDYGPWRFTPLWDGGFTAAYFDHAGLYSFGRQPEAIHWNLVQLATSLRAISPAEALTPSLERFPGLFQAALTDAVFARLGIVPAEPERDMALLAALEAALARQTVEIDRFFFDWRGGRRRGPSPADPAYRDEAFEALARALAGCQPVPGVLDHPYWADEAPCSMHIGEVEAIWARIDEADDWTPFEAKIAAMRRMGEAMAPPA